MELLFQKKYFQIYLIIAYYHKKKCDNNDVAMSQCRNVVIECGYPFQICIYYTFYAKLANGRLNGGLNDGLTFTKGIKAQSKFFSPSKRA